MTEVIVVNMHHPNMKCLWCNAVYLCLRYCLVLQLPPADKDVCVLQKPPDTLEEAVQIIQHAAAGRSTTVMIQRDMI